MKGKVEGTGKYICGEKLHILPSQATEVDSKHQPCSVWLWSTLAALEAQLH